MSSLSKFKTKVLILSDDDDWYALVTSRLTEVLQSDNAKGREERFRSVDEAGSSYFADPLNFYLLVVDAHAPLKTQKSKSSASLGAESIRRVGIGGGGYRFIEEYVLRSTVPPPPMLLISRFDDPDFDPIEAWLDVQCCVIAVSDLTPHELERCFGRMGIPSCSIAGGSVFEKTSDLANEGFGKHLASVLSDHCNRDVPRHQHQRAWEVVKWIDSDLQDKASRRKILENDSAVASINGQWPHLLARLGDQEHGNLRSFAWFYMLHAELLWHSRPVESLYAILRAMTINCELGLEPTGDHGDLAHTVALRIYNDTSWRRWRPRLPMSRGYDEKCWHTIIRDQVKEATKGLDCSTEVVRDLETRLAKLSSDFQLRSHGRAADEFAARSYTMRGKRLGPLGRIGYSFLRRSCDFGNRPIFLVGWCFATILVFAFAYLPREMHFGLGAELSKAEYEPLHAKPWIEWAWAGTRNFSRAFYLSVVTFITLGDSQWSFCDLGGRLIAMLEGVMGFLSLGLFVSVASTRLKPR